MNVHLYIAMNCEDDGEREKYGGKLCVSHAHFFLVLPFVRSVMLFRVQMTFSFIVLVNVCECTHAYIFSSAVGDNQSEIGPCDDR